MEFDRKKASKAVGDRYLMEAKRMVADGKPHHAVIMAYYADLFYRDCEDGVGLRETTHLREALGFKEHARLTTEEQFRINKNPMDYVDQVMELARDVLEIHRKHPPYDFLTEETAAYMVLDGRIWRKHLNLHVPEDSSE